MTTAPTPPPKPFSQILRDATTRPIPPGVAVALLVALAISAASVAAAQLLGGPDRFRGLIENAGPWAPLAYIGLKASTYVIAPLSGTPIKFIGGAIFGFWDGFVYALAGDVLGATINFWVARLFRLKGVTRLAGRSALARIDELTEHVGGWRALLAARLLLSSLYDFIAYAAGLSNISFRQFFLITVLAGIPWTLLSVWLGNAAFNHLPIFFGVFGLASLALIVHLIHQKRSSKS